MGWLLGHLLGSPPLFLPVQRWKPGCGGLLSEKGCQMTEQSINFESQIKQ